jgi:hypothetical protein
MATAFGYHIPGTPEDDGVELANPVAPGSLADPFTATDILGITKPPPDPSAPTKPVGPEGAKLIRDYIQALGPIVPQPPQVPISPRQREEEEFDLFGTLLTDPRTGALNPASLNVRRARLLGG